MREQKIYTIAGVKWIQKELTRSEFRSAIKLRENILDEISALKTFSDTLKFLDESGLIDDLIAFIIRPYGDTFFERVKYFVYRKLHFITRKNLSLTMSWGEIGEVIQDFFTMNTKFITNLNSMEKVLDLTSTPQAEKSE